MRGAGSLDPQQSGGRPGSGSSGALAASRTQLLPMDKHDKPKDKVRLDEQGKPDSKVDAEAEQKGGKHQGEQPIGNGATGKPAAFPPHN